MLGQNPSLSANVQKHLKNVVICAMLLICRTPSFFGPLIAHTSSIRLALWWQLCNREALSKSNRVRTLSRNYKVDKLLLIQVSTSPKPEYGTNLQFGCAMPVIRRDILVSTSRR